MLKNSVCVLSNSISLKKVTGYFQYRAKNNFSDRPEIALNKEVLRNSIIVDKILSFVCLTNFRSNLESVEHIPLEL